MLETNDILSELFRALGLSKDDIKIIRDEYKDSVVNKNENSIKQSDTPKKPQPEKKDTALTTSESRDGYVHVVTPEDNKSLTSEVTTSFPGSRTQQIAKDVLSIGDTYFELNRHVGTTILGGESIKIEFEDTFEGMTFPGITEKQLLWVLYVRYMKKDPKKVSLVKQLLVTEF